MPTTATIISPLLLFDGSCLGSRINDLHGNRQRQFDASSKLLLHAHHIIRFRSSGLFLIVVIDRLERMTHPPYIIIDLQPFLGIGTSSGIFRALFFIFWRVLANLARKGRQSGQDIIFILSRPAAIPSPPRGILGQLLVQHRGTRPFSLLIPALIAIRGIIFIRTCTPLFQFSKLCLHPLDLLLSCNPSIERSQ